MTGLYNSLYDLSSAMEDAGVDPRGAAIILDRTDYDIIRDAVDKECFHPREDWNFGGCFQYAGLTFVDGSSFLLARKH